MYFFLLAAATAFITASLCPLWWAPLIAFVISLAVSPFAIPMLHKLKFGQEIREEGPSWHQKKSGTPTMGGVIFIIAVAFAAIFALRDNFKGIMLVYLSMAFGVIGFIDDYIKVVKKRNLGLTEIQKLIMQLVASVLFVYLLYINGAMKTTLIIPFTQINLDLGIWYLPLAVLVIISAVNAVNLTDGIDGLATSVTVIVCLFFAVAGDIMSDGAMTTFACITAAALIGFLWFNKYPAKIFMGDTGSLFLGGAVAAMAVSGSLSIVLVIAGGVYVIETLSVILQVASFKLTGKRIFKMSPIHHHFEMCGCSEKKIVSIFSLAALVFCIIAYFGIGSVRI